MFEWDIGLVTFSEVDDDGFIGIQCDMPGEKNAGVEAGEMGAAYGMYSRPHDPSLDAEGEPIPSSACGVLHAYYGAKLHVWPQTDPRMMAKLPRVKKGGSVLYGGKLAQPSFVHIDGDSGALDGYFPYSFINGAPTKSMLVSVDTRTAGSESISLVHGSGMMVSMQAGGKNSVIIKNKSGGARVEVNDDGVTIQFDGASSLVVAPKLLDYLSALETVLGTIAAATIPPTAAAVTAFVAAAALIKLSMSTSLVKGA